MTTGKARDSIKFDEQLTGRIAWRLVVAPSVSSKAWTGTATAVG
ncbi:hypothetical protein THTE_1612 [Thermogutta terrifontis]|uniref:Uncharacterized protein n=1 Tax=Thermogutta terrifontis TaxID=1331910 RepID=A0A286RE20_9BACT|nr:hypothetical protein THTE_1612 [Thermogutta terrifontis]